MVLGLIFNNCSTIRVPVSSLNTTINLDKSHSEIIGKVNGSVSILKLYLIND